MSRRNRWRLRSNRLAIRLTDPLLVLRCAILGHRWTVNPRGTQRVCYPCWTVEDLDR